MTTPPSRRADAPIDPLFTDRWSPRSFDRSAISDIDLATLFEAARWAPSAFNHQPWRFVFARQGGTDWQRFVSLLMPFNAGWAQNASALVFILSDTLIQLPGKPEPGLSHSHSFDAGAAWAQLALQATRLGYSTHGMTGVDFARARTELGVPERFRIEAAIAIGRRGDKTHLPEQLQAREAPSDRRPVAELVMEGRWQVA
jgi:nitroreductase